MLLKTLQPGDEAALEHFLVLHTDSSMFLRANHRAAGLLDQGQPLQGTYVAAFEGGEIVAVAAHFWLGTVVVQAPGPYLKEVVYGATTRSRRAVQGILGPWDQALAARTALGLDEAPLTKDGKEMLYALDLSTLPIPSAPPEFICRLAQPTDLEVLTEWRLHYSLELLGDTDSPELRIQCRTDVALLLNQGVLWVLETQKNLLSCLSFNARLPDLVQLGFVWTPHGQRRRGYSRTLIAGALRATHAEGVQRAILFTGHENYSARRVYERVGFQPIGDYGLLRFTREYIINPYCLELDQ
ncbi:GNAT family N-acetyltransferase [Anthocerotibacter panamensis]|uniref:GNAT family N-acetyltransferase n=1 Tax=Anthocerotibacter panamensis TaxID=2857077 RepID=UPI001C4027DE|nr:GNAT family N-acetyltransferase [Anthocerotibacter panamensis]